MHARCRTALPYGRGFEGWRRFANGTACPGLGRRNPSLTVGAPNGAAHVSKRHCSNYALTGLSDAFQRFSSQYSVLPSR